MVRIKNGDLMFLSPLAYEYFAMIKILALSGFDTDRTPVNAATYELFIEAPLYTNESSCGGRNEGHNSPSNHAHIS